MRTSHGMLSEDLASHKHWHAPYFFFATLAHTSFLRPLSFYLSISISLSLSILSIYLSLTKHKTGVHMATFPHYNKLSGLVYSPFFKKQIWSAGFLSAEVNGEGVSAGLSLARSGAYAVVQLRGLATLPHNHSSAVLAPLKLEAGTGGPVRWDSKLTPGFESGVRNNTVIPCYIWTCELLQLSKSRL